MIKKRDDRIAAAGYFREELPARQFKRGFHLKYGDKVHKVKSVFGNRVVDENDNQFVSRHVLPVPAGSTDINTGGTNKVVAPADEKKKTALEPFKERISNFLGNLGKFEFEVANYMKEIGMAPLMVHGLSYRRAMQFLGFTVHGNARGSGKQLVTRTPQMPATAAAAPAMGPSARPPFLHPPDAPVRRRLGAKTAGSPQ